MNYKLIMATNWTHRPVDHFWTPTHELRTIVKNDERYHDRDNGTEIKSSCFHTVCLSPVTFDPYLPRRPPWIGPSHSCCPQGWWEGSRPGGRGAAWCAARRPSRSWSDRWRSKRWRKHFLLSNSDPALPPGGGMLKMLILFMLLLFMSFMYVEPVTVTDFIVFIC